MGDEEPKVVEVKGDGEIHQPPHCKSVHLLSEVAPLALSLFSDEFQAPEKPQIDDQPNQNVHQVPSEVDRLKIEERVPLIKGPPLNFLFLIDRRAENPS